MKVAGDNDLQPRIIQFSQHRQEIETNTAETLQTKVGPNSKETPDESAFIFHRTIQGAY